MDRTNFPMGEFGSPNSKSPLTIVCYVILLDGAQYFQLESVYCSHVLTDQCGQYNSCLVLEILSIYKLCKYCTYGPCIEQCIPCLSINGCSTKNEKIPIDVLSLATLIEKFIFRMGFVVQFIFVSLIWLIEFEMRAK